MIPPNPTSVVPQRPSGPTIKFDYIKSNFFRTVKADGIWGGFNGHLDIVMAFFSERPAIPQRVVHAIDGETIGSEIEGQRVGRDAVIREVEISVSMNLETAKSFRTWLDEKIEKIEDLRSKHNK